MKRTPVRRSNVSLMDVASYLGVSAMTVSRALHQPHKVSPKTLKRVQTAVEELNYLPNLAANTLRSNRSGIVVAIIPTFEQGVFAETLRGISEVLEQAGYQLLLGCSSYSRKKEESLVKSFLGYRPDGIILTGTHHTSATRKYLGNAGIPIVEIWDIQGSPIDMAVGFDNVKVGYDIAMQLVDGGFRRIGYVGFSMQHEEEESRAAQRSQGIYKALTEAGLNTRYRVNVDSFDMDTCGKTAADFVEANPQLQAIICADEIVGVGALVELERRSWRVPDDIAVVGIGDASITALVKPGLTTVRFFQFEIGTRATQLLLSRLSDTQGTEQIVDVGFDIVSRGSSVINAESIRNDEAQQGESQF